MESQTNNIPSSLDKIEGESQTNNGQTSLDKIEAPSVLAKELDILLPNNTKPKKTLSDMIKAKAADSASIQVEEVTPSIIQTESSVSSIEHQKPKGASLQALATARLAAQKFKSPDGPNNTLIERKANVVAEKMAMVPKNTGYLFNPDDIDLLPVPMQNAAKTLENGVESVQVQIDAYKGTIEMLMYWENLTNALRWTISIVITWFLARFNCSFTAVFLLLIFAGRGFKRDMASLRRKIRHDVTVTNSIKKLENDLESVEWLNSFVSKFWLVYEPGLSESIQTSVNGVLDFYKPAFLDDLRLTTFTLGSEAPRIEAIKTYPRTEDDVLMMDWDIAFVPFDEDTIAKKMMAISTRRNSKIELTIRIGKGVASIPIPVLLKEVGYIIYTFVYYFQMRVQFKFSTTFPHIKTIEMSFLRQPNVEFVLRPLKGMDLMDTPGLSSFLDETIAYQLAQNIVDPVKFVIPLEEWMGAVVTTDAPAGILKVQIHQAKNLKNSELIGVPDPYCKVLLGNKMVGRTKVIDDSLNPVWGETMYIIVYENQLTQIADKSDEIALEVLDFNDFSKDKRLGITQHLRLSRWIKLLAKNPGDESEDSDPLTESEKLQMTTEWGLPYDESTEIWRPLTSGSSNSNKGDVKVNMLYFPIPKVDPTVDLTTIEEVIDSGIITITIHQIKELAGANRNSSLFVIAETNAGKQIGETSVKKKSQAPIWDTPFDTFVTELEGLKISLKVREKKDLNDVPMGHATIDVKDVLEKQDATNDWFKLYGVTSGKIRVTLKFTPIAMGTGETYTKKEPFSFVRLTVHEAKGVMNVEMLKKSDPYVNVNVGTEFLGKTHHIENTLDPKWETQFETVVLSNSEVLSLGLFDFNDIAKDRSLGTAELRLCDIVPDEVISHAIKEMLVSLDTTDDGDVMELGSEGEKKDPLKKTTKSDVTSSAMMLRDEKLVAARRDGLRVDMFSTFFADVWCPIYFEKDNSVKQKGQIHFSLETFPVIAEKNIRVEKKMKKLPSKANLAETDVVEAVDESAAPITPTGSVNISKATAEENLSKSSIVSEFPSGILKLRVHEAKSLVKTGNIYVEIICGKSLYTTKTATTAGDPSWNEDANVFISDCGTDLLEIKVKLTRSIEKDADRKSDPTIGVWKGEGNALRSLFGKGNEWLILTTPINSDTSSMINLDQYGKIRVSAAYFPVYMPKNEVDDSGSLTLTVVSARDLEAADIGGASDPYCQVSFNSEKILQTKKHKKTLNPKFDETVTKSFKSKLKSRITLDLFDYNKIAKHASLGSCTFNLRNIQPNQKVIKEIKVEHAKSGFITVQIYLKMDNEVFEPTNQLAPKITFDQPSTEITTGKLPSKSHSISISGLGKMIKKIGAGDRDIASSEKNLASNSADPIAPHVETESAEDVVKNLRTSGSRHSLVSDSNSILVNSVFVGEGTIRILEARNLKSVDSNGLSDPFIVISQIGKKTKKLHKTVVVKKTLNPQWNKESFKITIPPSVINVAVKDHNTFSDVSIGDFDVDLFRTLLPDGFSEEEMVEKKAILKSFDAWFPVTHDGFGEVHLSGEILFLIK